MGYSVDDLISNNDDLDEDDGDDNYTYIGLSARLAKKIDHSLVKN